MSVKQTKLSVYKGWRSNMNEKQKTYLASQFDRLPDKSIIFLWVYYKTPSHENLET